MNDPAMEIRNELKYIISYGDYLVLKSVIKHCMALDSYAGEEGYHIRSLYFDDLHDSALYEKNFGVQNRKKYRIRVYNKSDRLIKLERKRKFTNHTNKEDHTLLRSDYERIMDREVDFLLSTQNNVAQAFYYEFKNQMLRPKVIVDYLREPYIMETGDVRITFDKQLSASSQVGDLFGEIVGRPVLNSGVMILEVKFTHFIPDIIRMYLGLIDKKPLAVSKYVLCREKIINNEWGL